MKKIIVTGSSSGFGLLTVQMLAKKGHTVYATMRNVQTKNSDVVHELTSWARAKNLDVRIIELDVTSDASVNEAVAQIMRESGQIDVLINNAGLLIWGLSETLSTRQMELMFKVNVFGADRMNKAVLPHMHRQQSGLLIQLSSGLSRLHLPYLGAYSATKAAVDTLAETLHYELSKTGIDSIIIQPGTYPTTDIINKLIPADNPSLAVQYGAFGTAIEEGIHRLFTPAPGRHEPNEVARMISELVDLPPGKRKLWNAVGIGPGQVFVENINDSTRQFSQRVQNLLGIYS